MEAKVGDDLRQLSLYTERDSIIHRIHPITKLVYIMVAILLPLVLPLDQILTLSIVVSFIILTTGRVLKQVVPLLMFSGFVLLTVVLIQGLFRAGNHTPAFQLGGWIFYQEGLRHALAICLQVVNILGAFSILVLTTKPTDLIEALVRKGLSPRIGYVLSSVLQIIPQMIGSMDTIMDAQRSRGLELEGNLAKRIKAFVPLIGPVVMTSLINVRERAMALEARGFTAKIPKTFLRQNPEKTFDYFIQAGLVILLLAAAVRRLIA